MNTRCYCDGISYKRPGKKKSTKTHEGLIWYMPSAIRSEFEAFEWMLTKWKYEMVRCTEKKDCCSKDGSGVMMNIQFLSMMASRYISRPEHIFIIIQSFRKSLSWKPTLRFPSTSAHTTEMVFHWTWYELKWLRFHSNCFFLRSFTLKRSNYTQFINLLMYSDKYRIFHISYFKKKITATEFNFIFFVLVENRNEYRKWLKISVCFKQEKEATSNKQSFRRCHSEWSLNFMMSQIFAARDRNT